LTDLESAKIEIKELLGSQSLGVLATQNRGQSYTSLVAFASSDDLRSLFFATTRSTRKYANLSGESRVAMLVDNRSNEASDFRWAKAVTAVGKAEELEPQRSKELLAIYLAKHPHLEDFVSSPSCAFLRIRVSIYYMVTRFQNVMEIKVTS
jgi:nitroimidazol reductase NimA-like FMN-containing flavoprotein (pyridoxamine 5'-phosphate oxidase superfamily)